MSGPEPTDLAGTRYAIVPEWVLDQASDKGVHLYARLQRYAGADGSAWPSRATLAEKLRCTVKTIDRTLVELCELGAVRVVKRVDPAKPGRHLSSMYVLALDPPGGDTHVARVATPMSPKRKPVNDIKPEKLSRADAADDPLLGFVEFWAAYPTRNSRRIGRGKCEARWLKLSLDERRAAWRGAVAYALERGDTRELSAADPERWLRDRRWVDYQAVVALPPPDTRHPSQSQRDPMQRGGDLFAKIRHAAQLEAQQNRQGALTE